MECMYSQDLLLKNPKAKLSPCPSQIQTDSMEAILVCRQFLSAAGTAEIKSPPDCK